VKYSLTIRKEAESDINNAFDYYENKRIGLGHDFLLCVEEALSKIERNPLHYKNIYKELRRIAVYRFPYPIFYLVQSQSIIVTAVFHARQDPQLWNDRAYKGGVGYPRASRFTVALRTASLITAYQPSELIRQP